MVEGDLVAWIKESTQFLQHTFSAELELPHSEKMEDRQPLVYRYIVILADVPVDMVS